MKITTLDKRNVCILGYGREGQATYAALKKHAPHARITIADSNPHLPARPDCPVITGPDYLTKLDSFDVIIKTPGIPWRPDKSLRHKLTSATEIFLDSIPTKTTVIGITGTKGKSTTSSLIAAILKEAHVKKFVAVDDTVYDDVRKFHKMAVDANFMEIK